MIYHDIHIDDRSVDLVQIMNSPSPPIGPVGLSKMQEAGQAQRLHRNG
jgi:hypothetical protein